MRRDDITYVGTPFDTPREKVEPIDPMLGTQPKAINWSEADALIKYFHTYKFVRHSRQGEVSWVIPAYCKAKNISFYYNGPEDAPWMEIKLASTPKAKANKASVDRDTKIQQERAKIRAKMEASAKKIPVPKGCTEVFQVYSLQDGRHRVIAYLRDLEKALDVLFDGDTRSQHGIPKYLNLYVARKAGIEEDNDMLRPVGLTRHKLDRINNT